MNTTDSVSTTPDVCTIGGQSGGRHCRGEIATSNRQGHGERPASGLNVRRHLLPALEVIALAALVVVFMHEGAREPMDRQQLAMTGLAPTPAGPAAAARSAPAERDLALLSTEDVPAYIETY